MSRNVLVLMMIQSLTGINATVIYATGAIIGSMLSPDKSVATLPISIFVIGMALSTLLVGRVVQKHGRRASFITGNLLGVVAGVLCAVALQITSFSLFNFAMIFGGASAAVALTYRFAATEYVDAEEKPKALSLVLLGGVASGILGPELVSQTMDVGSLQPYFVSYLVVALVGLITLPLIFLLPITTSNFKIELGSTRSTGLIFRQPKLIVAIVCGTVSYLLMNFMMTSAPLAMTMHGLSRNSANHGIAMHIVAMYLPSFITGRLISRFGERRVVVVGFATISIAALIAMNGMTVMHFWSALILLGIGWNFGFLGASAMVLNSHRSSEAPTVQSVNDFVIFGSMVIGSFASGGLLNNYGWQVVSSLMLPFAIIASLGVYWVGRKENRKSLLERTT